MFRSGKFQLVLWVFTAFSLFVALQTGYFGSTSLAQNTPFGAVGSVTVIDTASGENSYGEVTALATKHNLVGAKKNFVRQADYTEVEVVFAPEQAASAQEYQDYKYGDSLFTTKQSEEALRDIGIWVKKQTIKIFLLSCGSKTFL